MIVQTDSKWITYALLGAVLLGALIYDKANSVVTPTTRPPIVQVSPLQIMPDPVPVIIPDVPTLKPTQPIVIAPLPVATVTVAPTPAPQYATHVVLPGETLYSIARRYNTTIEAVMTKNRLTGYTIFVGQQLVIPR